MRRLSSVGLASQVKRRPGRRAFGVPIGGPWDAFAAASINESLSLGLNEAVWEISGQATFLIESDGMIAVGGDCEARRFPVWQGEEIRVACQGDGNFAYAAFREGSPLPLAKLDLFLPRTRVVRVLNLKLPFSAVMGRMGNRLGMRFVLDPSVRHTENLPSVPCDVGVIQVTPSGERIVLGPDGPTLGGYPQIGCVIQSDLRIVAQCPPGVALQFISDCMSSTS